MGQSMHASISAGQHFSLLFWLVGEWAITASRYPCKVLWNQNRVDATRRKSRARMSCSLLDQLRSGRWPPQAGVSFPGPMGLTYASFGITRAGQAEDRALYLEPRKVRDPGREAVYVYPYRHPVAVHVYHDVMFSSAQHFLPASGLAFPSWVQLDVQRIGVRVVIEPHSGLPICGSVCAACGEHVEGYGGGPGLFSGAEWLAGERLEVLCEAPL